MLSGVRMIVTTNDWEDNLWYCTERQKERECNSSIHREAYRPHRTHLDPGATGPVGGGGLAALGHAPLPQGR